MKNHILTAITAILLIAPASFAQDRHTIDSLTALTRSQQDSALVATYNELTWQYRMVNRDTAIVYGNKAIALGKQINYLKGVAQAYNDLGIIFYDKEDYDSAIHLYEQAMDIRSKQNDELGMAKLYNKIGIVYQKEGNFAQAEENQIKALALFRNNKNDIGIAYSLNNIGILNQNMGRYEEALRYHLESIAIKEKLKDNFGLAGSYVNVANIYTIREQYAAAETYYTKAIGIARQLKDNEYLSGALNNIGSLYTKMAKYDQALEATRESFELRSQLNDTKGMVSCLNNMGETFIRLQQYDSAEAKLTQALAAGKDAVNCKPELNKVYLTLSKLYEAKGMPGKALAMHKLYADTKDSLYTESLSARFADLETKYKTLEKEQQIQQQQFEITKRNYWIAGIAGMLVLGGLLGYSTYRRNQLKHRARLQEEILKQQDLATRAVIEAEENERKRIASDLHDGVGQMMSAARMNLSALQSQVHFDTPEQQTGFERVVALIDESCQEVRSVSHNMMPNALLKSGLASAVREFIDKIDKQVIRISLHTEGLQHRTDANVETVLYRVIQECVNNVIKHAGADLLDIALIKDDDGISVTIEDNGKGFDTTDRSLFNGIGMKNIQSRINYLKGTVEWDSAPGKGTVVAIHIPLQRATA